MSVLITTTPTVEGRRILRIYYSSFEDRLPPRYVVEHEEMIAAIEARDVEAADRLATAHADQIVQQIQRMIARDRSARPTRSPSLRFGGSVSKGTGLGAPSCDGVAAGAGVCACDAPAAIESQSARTPVSNRVVIFKGMRTRGRS